MPAFDASVIATAIEKAAVTYLEAHPELIEQIVAQVFGKLMEQLTSALATAPKK